MRASLWLAAVAAALALCLWPASAGGPPRRARHYPTSAEGAPERERLNHIKRQILSKLGLDDRPRQVRAPPRDIVRQILARAADAPAHTVTRATAAPSRVIELEEEEEAPREIIAIAKRDYHIPVRHASGQ